MQTAEAQKEAPKIEPVFDEDDVPAGKLDDAEIARLVSLSSKAAYNRTDNIPVKPKESFEPRTLVTIAMEAQRRREAELQPPVAQEVANKDSSNATEVSGTAEAADNLTANEIAQGSPSPDDSTEINTLADVTNEGASLSEANEKELDEAQLSEEEIAAAAEKLQAEYKRGLAEGRTKGEEAGHKVGHDKGYEAGRSAGQAEATAQLETAIQGFEKTTLALASSAVLDLDALTTVIHDAILSLASERAGMAIAEMPEAFATRIEAIIATIKQGTDHPQINLNPNDLLALKPIISTREKLQNCSLDADDTLAPGDVRLMIDGIGIEDELHRRVSRKVAVQPIGEPVDEGLNLALDAETDPAESEPKEPAATVPEDIGPAVAGIACGDEFSENSTTSQSGAQGGFSIGLKNKDKVDDGKDTAAERADEIETDQT